MSQPPESDGIGMIWWAKRHPPRDPNVSFTGKTVLVTGSNVGLGFESAVKFAALGAARLLLGVRSVERGEAAKAEICRRTGRHAADIDVLQVDMSNFKSVRQFAEEIQKTIPILNVVVLNAGMAAATYQASPEGYEMSLQVNVLSTALLAILLLPKLRSSAATTGMPSRLELMSSVSHSEITATDLSVPGDAKLINMISEETYFDIKKSYGVNKLLLMYVADGLAAATKSGNGGGQEIIVNTVCPGLCKTNLGRDFPGLVKIPIAIFHSIFARSAEEGSRSVVSGVSLGEEAHGQFWSHDMFFRKGALLSGSDGLKLQVQVWTEVTDLLRKHAADLDKCLMV